MNTHVAACLAMHTSVTPAAATKKADTPTAQSSSALHAHGRARVD